jgi:hypothetical protein
MMIKLVPGRANILGALLILLSSAVVAKELATIETHPSDMVLTSPFRLTTIPS